LPGPIQQITQVEHDETQDHSSRHDEHSPRLPASAPGGPLFGVTSRCGAEQALGVNRWSGSYPAHASERSEEQAEVDLLLLLQLEEVVDGQK
jgi:hypothetical protein